jgi:Calcineurin-like phosphoesterase
MRRTLECVVLAAALWSSAIVAAKAVDPAMPSLAPLPAGSKPLDPNPNATSFSFIFAGDNRPASASCAQPPQLTDLVNDIKSSQASFVLWGGDIIYGKDVSKATGEYPAFVQTVQGAGIPIVAVPGNHEMSVKGTVDCPVPGKKHKQKKIDEPDRSGKLAAAYEAAIGSPYGVFRYGNAAFIGVNTDDALDAEYDPGDCGYNGYVGKAQVDALKGALDSLSADASVAHIFVFMHRPLHGAKSKDELGPSSVKQIGKFQSLLETKKGKDSKYPKLSFVLASHEHLFYAYDSDGVPEGQTTFSRKDPSSKGPSFLVSGGAGAPLADGGHFHYLNVSVEGENVTATYVPITDTSSNCSPQ